MDQASILIWVHSAEILHLMLQPIGVRRTLTVGLAGWLAGIWTKRWPTGRKLKVLDLLWFKEEPIQRLSEIRMFEWIGHLRPTYSLWEGPEDILFIPTVRKKLARGPPASLRSSMIVLFQTPGLRVETAVTELET